uniref:Uncharacterized protein n=1 Tax=Sphaerodactylus townsendi TaxID=933632 RepID=A0ACB8FJ33_9SAUR
MIVKCRGQQDIQFNVDLASAIQKEREFFKDHKHFRILLDEKRATIPLLAEKLTSELVEHINKSLPTLEEQINTQLQKANHDLLKCGKDTPSTESEKLNFLINKIKLFNQDITNSTQGEEALSENDTRLFTKIRKEFQEWGKKLHESARKTQKGFFDEIWRFEQQYRGRELPGFISYKTFETIIKQQIIELEAPAIEMLKKVTEMIRQDFTKTAKDHFADFRNLYRAAKNRIEDIKEQQLKEAECTARTQFAMEQFLYCQDHIYSQDLNSVREQTAEEEKNPLKISPLSFNFQNPEKFASVKEMAYHLEAYFNGENTQESHKCSSLPQTPLRDLVSAGKRLSCQIPLIILFYMLKKNGDNLQNEMLKLLQTKEEIGHLLQERKDVAEQRQLLHDRIDRLTQAQYNLAKFSG